LGGFVERMQTFRDKRIGFHALYSLWSALVLLLFLHAPGLQHYAPSSLGGMVYGTASRPFVFRTLIPTTIRVLTSAVPDGAKRALVDYGGRGTLGWFLRFCDKIPPALTLELLIALPLLFASLLGFLYSLRALFRATYHAAPGVENYVPLVALLLLPPFFCYTSFLYDFPTLFFFTLALLLLVRRRWRGYLLVFAISCFNKETTVLLGMVYGLYFWRDPGLSRARFWLVGIAQAFLFAAIKLTIAIVFSANPGRTVEYHFDHTLWLMQPYTTSTAMAWLLIVILIAHRWAEQPRFLRLALLVLIPLVLLTVFLGLLDELRDYYEAFPAGVLLLFHGAARLCGVEVTAMPPPPERATPS
jgi:hypothetical protein